MSLEGQLMQSMAYKKQMIVGLLDKLCQQVEITDTQFQTAKTRYEAVGAWLSSSNLQYFYKVYIYPQGSIALGTAVKPLATNEFDVDLVCHLPSISNTASASNVKQLVGNRLKEHTTYRSMLEEKQRCWRINYANEFHLDITPSIINPRCQQDGELVPDRTLIQWKPTNPKGYINRFELYANIQPNFHFLEKRFPDSTYGSIETLPEPTMSKPFLKRIVQLLKRHRDQHFLSSNLAHLAPISVIITTLASWAYAKCCKQKIYANEFDFITDVIGEMPTFIRTEMRYGNTYYTVENESTEGENFADKWNEDPNLAIAFFEWHRKVLISVESLLQIEGLDKFTECLVKEFGGKRDELRNTLSKFIEPIGQARAKGLLGISPSTGLIVSTASSALIVPKNTFFGS